jgi:hypothetical protein
MLRGRALTRVTNRPTVNTITSSYRYTFFLLFFLWPDVASDQSSQLEETISCGDHREGLIVLGTTRGNLRIFQLIPQGAPSLHHFLRDRCIFSLLAFSWRCRFIQLSQEILAAWIMDMVLVTVLLDSSTNNVRFINFVNSCNLVLALKPIQIPLSKMQALTHKRQNLTKYLLHITKVARNGWNSYAGGVWLHLHRLFSF